MHVGCVRGVLQHRAARGAGHRLHDHRDVGRLRGCRRGVQQGDRQGVRHAPAPASTSWSRSSSRSWAAASSTRTAPWRSNSPEVVKALEIEQRHAGRGRDLDDPRWQPRRRTRRSAPSTAATTRPSSTPPGTRRGSSTTCPTSPVTSPSPRRPSIEGGDVATIGGGGTGTAVIESSKKKDFAAEWLAFAKLSPEANVAVWEVLGFDPVNMSVWEDEAVTHNPDNKFNKYFKTNLFDVLNEVKDGHRPLRRLLQPEPAQGRRHLHHGHLDADLRERHGAPGGARPGAEGPGEPDRQVGP